MNGSPSERELDDLCHKTRFTQIAAECFEISLCSITFLMDQHHGISFTGSKLILDPFELDEGNKITRPKARIGGM